MKMMKTKHFRRWAVFLAMIAPAVYLFGSLFSALTGANGAQVFAEPVYTDQYVEVDGHFSGEGYVSIGSNVSVSDLLSLTGNHPFPFVLNGDSYVGLYSAGYSSTFRSIDAKIDDSNYNRLAQLFYSNGAWNVQFLVNVPWDFYGLGSNFSVLFEVSGARFFVKESVPTSLVPENAGAYSDYIFKNFFAKDNFLEQWGENAISENPYGFAPFGAFWRYLDTNVLHFSNDQVGLMGYGYMYYASHVLLFDIGFIIVTFFLDFIQRIFEKFTGGE